MKEKTANAGHVSGVNAQVALNNIQEKCLTLEEWLKLTPALKDGRVEGFPRTKRQFIFWTCSASSIAPRLPRTDLRTTSNETLNRNNEEHERVDRVLKRLAEYERAAAGSGRKSRIGKLEARLARSERLRGIAESALTAALIQAEKAKGEVRRLEAELTATAHKSKAAIDQLEAELEAERAKNGALAQALSKVTKIRGL